ncbi:hypothetical protein E2C01_016950 [Portunus trituberculatus]|uniref:Uncharacterized protein n=1 Tax=Portunus trituberculatus TaxID=210409 RepID=A0A5B7DSA1_PORTR|nr:hypothetical protein [Portunus trituberculatus]
MYSSHGGQVPESLHHGHHLGHVLPVLHSLPILRQAHLYADLIAYNDGFRDIDFHYVRGDVQPTPPRRNLTLLPFRRHPSARPPVWLAVQVRVGAVVCALNVGLEGGGAVEAHAALLTFVGALPGVAQVRLGVVVVAHFAVAQQAGVHEEHLATLLARELHGTGVYVHVHVNMHEILLTHGTHVLGGVLVIVSVVTCHVLVEQHVVGQTLVTILALQFDAVLQQLGVCGAAVV